MREFFASQGLADVRIEHTDSDFVCMKDNLIAIIDCPITGSSATAPQESGIDSEEIETLFRVQRLVSTLCIPRALRVFVGNSSVLESEPQGIEDSRAAFAFLKDLVKFHGRDDQIREIEVGAKIVDYEEALRP
jgi:hypothetical protein